MACGGREEYYHTDHLGSATFINDNIASVAHQIAYLPYGEEWVDMRRSNGYAGSPYKFNGKEKDDETGYSYYGARYYTDRLSIWLSVDPLADKYPHLSPYAYCADNPVMLVDPDGRSTTEYRDESGNLLYCTNDGLKDVIIVSDKNIPKLEQRLQYAKDNGTINDGEINKSQLHVLGQTPQQYSEQKIKGMDSYWVSGYKTTYEEAYRKGKSLFSLEQFLYSIIDAIATENNDNSGTMLNGGRTAGIIDGNSDRKNNKINRLYPYSSFKNNSPSIVLDNTPKQQTNNCILKQKSLLK